MRYLLAFVVVSIGALSVARADAPDLIKKLASKDNEVRRQAAQGLGELGKDAKSAVKPLIKALKDEDRFVRRFAAQALGNIGPDARAAIPGLSGLLNDDKQAVREAGIKALGKMGTSAVPALTKALSGTSDVQEWAITALGQTGEAGIPALSSAIRNPKMAAGLRVRAVAALPKGESARSALPALVEVTSKRAPGGREGRQLRVDAINAVGRLATTSDSSAVKALDDIVKDEKLRDKQVKNAAQKALKAVKSRT